MRLVDSLRHDHHPQRVPGFLRRLMALGSSVFSHTGIRFCSVTWVSLVALKSRIHFSIPFLNRALTVIPAFLRQHAPTYPQQSATAYAFAGWHSVREGGRFFSRGFPFHEVRQTEWRMLREKRQRRIQRQREKERKKELEALKEEAKRCYTPVCAREIDRERERAWETQQQTERINIAHICV